MTAPAAGPLTAAVPDSVTTPDGVRDGSSPAADVVDRKHEWLASHPGGVIGRPRADQLIYAATVRGVEIARAYAGLAKLMDLIDQAEAEGRCPLHPPAGGSPS